MQSSSSSSRSRGRLAGLIALFSAAALVAAGCAAGATPSLGPGAGAPTVSGAWVRPTTAAGSDTAAYMTITNASGAADALTAVSVTFAAEAQVHQTTSMSGMMGMSEVAKVDVPAGGSVRFEPGGYHVMIMGVTGTLTVGQSVDLVLTFQKAGKVTVRAEVKNG